MKRQELMVAAIENGTVIDHIPSNKIFDVIRLLHLDTITTPIMIGYNLPSSKMETHFHVVPSERGCIKCHYCEKEQSLDNIRLV